MLEELENENQQDNYPVESDDSFTPDQIDEIKTLKQKLQKEIDKNDSLLRGLESFFWGITSYSLSKAFVLYLGLSGIHLAATCILIMNQIVNRDLLDGFNLNRLDGEWKVTGMDKLFKLLFGFLVSGFVFWSALGEVIQFQRNSVETYETIRNVSVAFNKLPKKDQNEVVKTGFLGIGLLFVLYAVVNKK